MIGSARLMCTHLFGPSHGTKGVAFSFMVNRAFNAFMDASGKPEHGPEEWCVVAGFISTVDMWEQFESQWGELLVRYSIPYLQMSSLHARKKPYEESKWNDHEYMKSFLSEAAEIVRSNTMGWCAQAVRNADFSLAVESRPGLAMYTNAYGLCGTGVALRLQMPHIKSAFPERPSIEHFFEEGDHGIANIGSVFARCNMQQPIVRPGKPRADNPSLRYYAQFQAADWLAFETRRLAKKCFPNPPIIRPSLAALLKGMRGEAKIWKLEDLITFCDRKISKGEMQ